VDRARPGRWRLLSSCDVVHPVAQGLRQRVPRRQGLLAGTWCLDPTETLSPGQAEEIDRVCRQYPELTDDDFVRDNLDRWMR